MTVYDTIQSVIPLLIQISLQDLGILLAIDLAILNELSPSNPIPYFYWILLGCFLLWVVGFLRYRTDIEFSINNEFVEGLRFEQIKKYTEDKPNWDIQKPIIIRELRSHRKDYFTDPS
jgi:hypothetical protein